MGLLRGIELIGELLMMASHLGGFIRALLILNAVRFTICLQGLVNMNIFSAVVREEAFQSKPVLLLDSTNQLDETPCDVGFLTDRQALYLERVVVYDNFKRPLSPG